DPGAGGVPILAEHPARGGEGVGPKAQRSLDRIEDAWPPWMRGHQVDLRQGGAGDSKERFDRLEQVAFHHLRQLTAEDHPKSPIAQLVAEMPRALRYQHRPAVLHRPAGRRVASA